MPKFDPKSGVKKGEYDQGDKMGPPVVWEFDERGRSRKLFDPSSAVRPGELNIFDPSSAVRPGELNMPPDPASAVRPGELNMPPSPMIGPNDPGFVPPDMNLANGVQQLVQMFMNALNQPQIPLGQQGPRMPGAQPSPGGLPSPVQPMPGQP